MKKVITNQSCVDEISKQRKRWGKMSKITVDMSQLDLDFLRSRFERMQKKYPHKMNPKLTNKWVVKMCIIESRMNELKRVKRKLIDNSK